LLSNRAKELEEPEDLLDFLKPTQEKSEEYEIILKTLANADPKTLKLFTDLTPGQIYWISMASMYRNIVRRAFGKDHAKPIGDFADALVAYSVSKNRKGRVEIIEALKRKEEAKKEEAETKLEKIKQVIK